MILKRITALLTLIISSTFLDYLIMKKLSVVTPCKTNDLYIPTGNIVEIQYSEGSTKLKLDKGGSIQGVCCHCNEKYCYKYSEQELSFPTSSLLGSFPKNPNKNVCPVKAITFNVDGEPSIDDDKCIACGLCLNRCPFGAFYIDTKSLKVSICNSQPSNSYKGCTESEQEDYIHKLECKKTTLINRINSTFVENISKKLSKNARIEDIGEIVVRNTFLNAKIHCGCKVHGNNHNRIEFFAELNEYIIIGETLLSDNDHLSITRRLLDGLAVMKGRYNKDTKFIIPIAVLNSFPNKRTDFYEVISDIKNVVDIQVVTIPFHIFCLFNIFNIRLDKNVLCEYIVNKNKYDISAIIKNQLGNNITIDTKTTLPLFEPIK